MAIKEMDIVKVNGTSQIGQVTHINRKTALVRLQEHSVLHPIWKKFKLSELEFTVLPVFTSDAMKKFIRGEVSFSEITGGSNIFPDDIEGEYRINLDDIWAGLQVIKKASYEEQYAWATMMKRFYKEIRFPYKYTFLDGVTDLDILVSVFYALGDFSELFEDEKCTKLPEGAFDELEDYLDGWLNHEPKRYPEVIMRTISYKYSDSDIDSQPEKVQELFKQCLDGLCEKNISDGFEKRAYCYYCGTKIYPQNWMNARDDLEKICELSDDKTAAGAANSLGYIYYYGRCTGGVPEYDKAFKYFSIGHAYGYYESTYKLADMFLNGYGVRKNEKTAFRLYSNVYESNYKHFIAEDFRCNFADAALRMGNCYMRGIGCHKNPLAALEYFLKAELAIKKRTEKFDDYGDDVVSANIRKALAEARKEYPARNNYKLDCFRPEWTKWFIIPECGCKIKIKRQAKDVLVITARHVLPYPEWLPVGFNPMKWAPDILVCAQEADYCELKNKLTVKTAPDSKFKVYEGIDELVFNCYKYYDLQKKTVFYLYDKPVGEIVTDRYYVSFPKKKKTLTGRTYHLASIRFDGSNGTYDYICDDPSVGEGDRVVVMGYDGETEVTVVSVSDKDESELLLPVKKYKKVLRKARRE